ncbi:MAG TPA: PAS domain S-box protein [Coleofasciculaceae cyanobacterium]|jgi:PAS domain S-box-containing protein
MSKKVNILVVEDEGIIALNIRTALEELGYQVTAVVQSGEVAIKVAESTLPDLVLMDIRLPGKIDGITAAEQISTRFKIPVVYLTAHDDSETLQRAKITQPLGYILKPFEIRELVSTIDLALYKHAWEQQLKEREQWLRTTLTSIADAVITTDSNALITFMNPAAESLTGWNSEDILGLELSETFRIINERTREVVESPTVSTLLSEVKVSGNNTLLIKRDNTEIPIDYTVTPIKDETHKVKGAVLVFHDITEQKQAEILRQQTLSELEVRIEERTQKLSQTLEALRQSEERLRMIIEDQTELLCRFKPDGTMTFVNDAYCRYFNRERESLIGQKFLPQMPPEDRSLITKNFRSLSIEKPINTYEHRVILPTGEIRWQQWSDRALFDEQGNFIECQAVGRDITQLKQAEADIRNALEKEKELSELRSSFVSLVSHEFRTPLTTIQSSNEMLERYSHRLSEAKKDTHHQRIHNAVQRMTELLDDILTIGQAEAGKLKFEPTPIDLVAFCQNIVESMQISAAPQHTLTFSTYGDCSNAQMDEKLLGHIVTNLLSNAIKYSPSGGNVEFDLIGNQGSVILRIRDSGIGIPSEDLDGLFESFGRASNVGTIQGTGLGLAIVKNCVELHQGQIAVDSAVGVGTMFTVTLPLKTQRSNVKR